MIQPTEIGMRPPGLKSDREVRVEEQARNVDGLLEYICSGPVECRYIVDASGKEQVVHVQVSENRTPR